MTCQRHYITLMAFLTGVIITVGSHDPASAQMVQEIKAYRPSDSKMTWCGHRLLLKDVTSTKPLKMPVYKPPKGIGAPGGRVGGGTRGGEDPNMLRLFALVPDHLGLTIREQPSLYWYVSRSAPHRLVLTINHEELVKPVFEQTIAETVEAGIHSVNLQDLNVRLELEKEYRWFVELALDADYPARNTVAGGRIKRIAPPETLLAKLREAERQEVTSIYSEGGLWYEALASISNLIDRHPGNPVYPTWRNFLFQQVELDEIASEQDIAGVFDDSTFLPGEYEESGIPTLVGHTRK
ncbi:MAG: DUF928 domain-containing protein [Nitrospirales bacterium]|nr:DUF928 domain-containing protein [Nitrospira sp.]MDR4500997.1 DUF928 domain-containing protein [Nitrospirales bacterium]